MSLWELSACADGWAKAHGAQEKPEAPSEEEFLARIGRG